MLMTVFVIISPSKRWPTATHTFWVTDFDFQSTQQSTHIDDHTLYMYLCMISPCCFGFLCHLWIVYFVTKDFIFKGRKKDFRRTKEVLIGNYNVLSTDGHVMSFLFIFCRKFAFYFKYKMLPKEFLLQMSGNQIEDW